MTKRAIEIEEPLSFPTLPSNTVVLVYRSVHTLCTFPHVRHTINTVHFEYSTPPYTVDHRSRYVAFLKSPEADVDPVLCLKSRVRVSIID